MELPIIGETPIAWVTKVLADFPSFLQDHASCERKAAALAMSFVTKASDKTALVEPMTALAREELEHFSQVFRIMQKLGIPLAVQDEKDQYVNTLLQSVRHGRQENLLDKLLVSSLIEARSYERFALLAKHLNGELAAFYQRLALAEKGHYKVFILLSRKFFTVPVVEVALQRLVKAEYHAMMNSPIRAAMH